VSAHHARLQRLEHALHEQVNAWRLSPVVEALQALRGGPCTVALTLVAAMGDLTRFASPRERMQLMGLMPSEPASGAPRRQGSITQAGNTHARRVLVAGAWAYRYPAQVSRHLPLRLDKQPNILQDISGQAQVRRCQRYRRLVSRGTHANGVTVAMARALTGFMWAIAQEVPIVASDAVGSERHASLKIVQLGKVPRGMGRDAAPVWCHPRRREAAWPGHSSRERGRHPTEASTVVTNPRISAGATVAECWLRLCRCPEGKKS
jgi:Transposase IS116/IS110/IS902 family